MAFAQITGRRSLRDLVICLRARRSKLYHMGICGGIARTALADANRVRDWRVWQDIAQAMIRIARPLYRDEDLGLELDNTVYALDASTIDLSLNAFPWARFRSTKGAVKIHTLMDVQGSIPTFVRISDGKLHDVKVLDELPPEPGAIDVMDRDKNVWGSRSQERVLADLAKVLDRASAGEAEETDHPREVIWAALTDVFGSRIGAAEARSDLTLRLPLLMDDRSTSLG